MYMYIWKIHILKVYGQTDINNLLNTINLQSLIGTFLFSDFNMIFLLMLCQFVLCSVIFPAYNSVVQFLSDYTCSYKLLLGIYRD